MKFIGTHYAHKYVVLCFGFQKHFRDGKPAKRDKNMLCYNFNGDGSGPCATFALPLTVKISGYT